MLCDNPDLLGGGDRSGKLNALCFRVSRFREMQFFQPVLEGERLLRVKRVISAP